MANDNEKNKPEDGMIPDEDYEYEKKLAEEERRKREEAEQKKLRAEEERKRRMREAQRERERQIARDKLDLMKMKQGIADESETIEEVHEEHRELHGFEKLANIWYHDKTWILLGAFIFCIVLFIVIDTVTRVDPDVEVFLIADNPISRDETCNLLAQRIERYTPDLNGDGKIKVSVISCPMNNEKYDQMYVVNSQKFYANLQQGQIIMVITDQNTMPDVMGAMVDDLPEQIEGNRYIDKEGLSLDFEFLAREIKCPEMTKGNHISLRMPLKTLGDSQEKMQKNYDDCLAILKAMADDLQAEADRLGDKGLPETAPQTAESVSSEVM